MGQETFVFPLQVGNKWFLRGNDPGIYDYVVAYTIDDTIRIDKKLYYDINPGLFASDALYRIDSLGNFIEFDRDKETILCNFALRPGESVLMKFDPEKSDSAFCYCKDRELKISIVGEERLEIRYDLNWSQITPDQYTYLHIMDGVGLSALGKVWYDNPYKLIGALINGQFYGDSVATCVKERTNIPQTFSLYQNFPNPFNCRTSIRFELDEAATIELNIFDVAGRKVQNLICGQVKAGYHEAGWNAANYSSGTYICELRKNNKSLTRKILLQK
jgi:hypothetical protein